MEAVPSKEGAAAVRGHQIALGLALFALIWLLALNFANLVPPKDNIEQLNWVRALQWGYYKHPPLPTWMLWLGVRVFGPSAALTYILGAACTLASMALLWRLLVRVRGADFAITALLAALSVTYYNDRLFFFNHNIVLMLATAGAASLAHAGMTRDGVRWWVGLGVVLGLGALAKYQMAVTGLSLLAFWISQRGWESHEKRVGLAVSIVVALLVFSPHLYWLAHHGYQPVVYAMTSSLGIGLDFGARMIGVVTWLADQIFNRALPAWLLLLLVAAPWRSPTSLRVPRLGPARDCTAGLPPSAMPFIERKSGLQD